MRKTRLCGALAALSLCAAPGRGADPEPPAEPVTLEFAWPAGRSARVETSLRRRATDQGKVKEVSLAGAFRLRIEKDPRGLKLVTDEPRITNAGGRPVPEQAGPEREELVRLFQVLGLFPPTRIVDAEAEIVAIEAAGDARSLLEGGAARTGDPRADALLRELAGPRASAEASADRAREHWLLTTYTWDGAELELGEEYEIEEFGEMQVGPGVVANLSLRLSAAARVPCRAGESEARCVRLTAAMSVDPEAQRRGLEAAARALSQRLPGALPEDAPVEGAIKAVSSVKEVEVVVEPASLLPHHVIVRHRERLESNAGETSEKLTEHEQRYTW